MIVVGADPGSSSGAVALLDGDEVIAWWAYSRIASGWRVRWHGPGGPTKAVAPTLPRLARLVEPVIAESLPGGAVLVLEGLFQARRQGLLTLAESAGVWLATLEPLCSEVRRPRAQEWRRDVLGLSGDVSAERAEEYAVAWARRHLRWRHPPDGLTRIEEGATCEAACMATTAARVRG